MKKVLLITDKLEHYRVPLFNSLCDKIDLTVAHSSKHTMNAAFREHFIDLARFGPFINYKNLPDFSRFDVIIFPFNIRCLKLWQSFFTKRSYKLIVFGIGVSASYGKLYDQDKSLNVFRKLILRKSDAAIFYEKYPFIKYSAEGIDSNKMSVAYNTVVPNAAFDINKKEYRSFIFVGSLYRQKRIFDLLEAYYIAYNSSNGTIYPLEIIGEGEEKDRINEWIKNRNLGANIIMHGHIDNDVELLPIFNRAIACISPGQAGLSVQKCFSYGVPFITGKNPITGGEFFSIIDGVNGYFYDSSIFQLSTILLSFDTEKQIKELSENAHIFYSKFRNIDIWKKGFLQNIL